MTRAFVTYVRPLLKYASCVWSPYLLKHIKRIESVQKRFTKRLFSISHLGCLDRLKAIGLESLELRRLHHDLLCTYKVLFGKLEMDHDGMFLIRSQSTTRGHSWKLFPKHCHTNVRKHFFCERVIAPWNCLNINSENLRSITSFKRLIKGSDLSAFVHYF